MKILCSCRNMNHVAGGVEKMLSTLMHEMLARGHEVALITWDPENTVPFYKLDPCINWHKLSIGDSYQKATWKTRWQRALKVRDIVALEKPDVILTFQNGAFLSIWSYTIGMGVPVIVSERNALTMYDYTSHKKYKFLWRQVYGLAPRVIIQTESQKNMYPAWIQKKIDVISNPVFPPRQSNVNTQSREKTILCVGRLSFQKNQIVLLKAFTKIFAECPDWSVQLVGDGGDREALETYAKNNDILEKVDFIGNLTDLSPYYQKAGIFCLPSRWEGFPNALAEALACGAPSIGFSDCAGVNDLIQSNQNGILAEGMDDVDTLAAALLNLIKDDDARLRMSQHARTITDLYRPEQIFNQWEDVLKQAAR